MYNCNNIRGSPLCLTQQVKELFQLVKRYSILLLPVDFSRTDITNSKLTIYPFALVAHFVFCFLFFFMCTTGKSNGEAGILIDLWLKNYTV